MMTTEIIKKILVALDEHKESYFNDQKVDDDYAIINDRLAYSTKEKAESISEDLGCSGYHEHEFEGQTWYMPCESHSLYDEKKCPEGYKRQDGKCVKK